MRKKGMIQIILPPFSLAVGSLFHSLSIGTASHILLHFILNADAELCVCLYAVSVISLPEKCYYLLVFIVLF